MASEADATVPSTRRVRKSVGTVAMKKTMDKENATVDVASTLAADRKKSRSKSLGPGGLDALKHGNRNRRASIAAPMPRSILKPTAYAVPEIPPLRNGAQRTRKSSEYRESTKTLASSSSEDSKSSSKVALKTEAEQQAAAREREERERRDARRKSLANRRVSFAAEATLHTFHEIEYMQDSTTSTDSSRRASSASGGTLTGTVPRSPESKESGRRNSVLPAVSFASNNEDDTLTSTIYSSDSEPADDVEEVEDHSGSSSDSDDGTMMTIETEEVTGTTVASERFDSDDDSSTLDRALRAAVQTADTQRLNNDEDNELDDGEEVIPSFGWVKKKNQPSASANDTQNLAEKGDDGTETEMDMDMDMDMTSAVGGILKPQQRGDFTRDMTRDDDMSMEVTQALGGILSQDKTARNLYSRSSANPETQDDVTLGQTMEFTTAIGGINQPNDDIFDNQSDANEDFSMEFTTAMGGVLSQERSADAAAGSGQSIVIRQAQADAEDTMDMTVAYGAILPSHTRGENTSTLEDETMDMDITAAVGGILGREDATSRNLGKRILEAEVNGPLSPDRAIMAAAAQRTPTRRSSRLSAMSQAASPRTKTESPGLSAFRGNGLRRSNGPQTPEYTLSSPLRTPTPSPAKPTTPRAQAASPGTPARAARSKSPRSCSPRRKESAKTVNPSPSSQSRKPLSSLFRNDEKTGARTPTIVLTPQTRRLSGLGADRSGLGSPQVTALLEKRASIGDSASDFVAGKRGITFEDPEMMNEEVDRARQDEEAKEKLQRQSAQKNTDATLNLREMIDSLSPKRNMMKGRKSLHVGSAKGLLGKRPAELDDDEDSEDHDGVKRLKGHQGSPVKNIKLQQPPSVAETTGRMTRSTRRSLEPNLDNSGSASGPLFASPLKNGADRTRRHLNGKDKHRDHQTIHDVNYAHADGDDANAEELENSADAGRIHLQDFLNMTSIRFMELTTTKRRHTVAPNSLQNGSTADGEDAMTLERCVVAGACTIPMLELYQHSCRELKNYIAEGRRIVKEIEAETLEENPPLFREYISATPDVKALMDNQFKNVKTHARLLSKAMWYEWRSKLQEGLREGLVKISQDMDADEKVLQEQEDLLAAVLPGALKQYEELEEESGNLEEAARELADCDPAELEAARDDLTSLDEDIAEKKRLIAELRRGSESSVAEVESLTTKKQDLLQGIQEAEKVRQACRGWTCSEVASLKARVDAIEKQHGWAVTGLTGTNLSMTYKREIEIVFDVASFQPHEHSSRIDLWYIGDGTDATRAKTAEKEFFLQCIRDHVRALQQNRTKIVTLLNIVRTAWDKARFVTSQIDMINVTFPTSVVKTSDSSVAVRSSLLLSALKTRVETTLHLRGQSMPQGVDIGISTQVQVVYGEHFNVGKVGEFLANKIGSKMGAKEEGWSEVLVELHQRLVARGKKQASGTMQS
ncbi:hypothetical protein E4U42_005305 [Claviceps africana]|uniref:Spc7 kinetochore protein domain-containing protein n=1 Tax=Claviceps africana TaxID=83212 RepID=A0A8K0NKI7_9HYPO|nr:hypothetical protein E4U42_005305 [Claviceps africana]